MSLIFAVCEIEPGEDSVDRKDSSEVKLERQQLLPGTPAQVFPFFAEARNLERITPPLLRFEVLTPDPIRMGAGTLIRYRLRVRGIGVRWLTVIKEWDPPHSFVDVQVKGPYKRWHHTHEFEEIEGGTLMRDVVDYEVGYGPLGLVADSLLIRRDLKRIFDFRAVAVAGELPG